jgi:hypothetical protein
MQNSQTQGASRHVGQLQVGLLVPKSKQGASPSGQSDATEEAKADFKKARLALKKNRGETALAEAYGAMNLRNR